MRLLPVSSAGLVGLLSAATTGLPASPADAAEGPVLVLESRAVALPGVGSKALRNTIEAAIKSQGGEVVRPRKLAVPEAGCTTPECYQRVSEAAKAAYVLRVDGKYVNDGYELYMEMWSASSGEIARGQDRRCQVCSASEMLEHARDQATLLYATQLHPPAKPPAPAVAEAKAPPEPGPAPAKNEPPVVLSQSSPPPKDQGGSILVPSIVAGGGVAVAAVGIYFWATDGRETNCKSTELGRMCFALRDTRALGMSLLGAGLVATAVGGFMIYRVLDSQSASASVAVGPGSLTLKGTF